MKAKNILRKFSIVAFLFGLLYLGGCSSEDDKKDVTITYWIWDIGQLPAYEAAAKEFEKLNPEIKVRIEQIGWADYWISLTTAFVSETAPDVFANHLTRYPQFLEFGVLMDVTKLAERDGIRSQKYIGQLFELWSKDGRQFGIPKDWDTVAIVYNKEMISDAGVSEERLWSLDWNPADGGSFAKLLGELSVDSGGNSVGMDKDASMEVARYGLLLNGSIDAFGQEEWSHFAASNGFQFSSSDWSGTFNYDDPRLAEVLGWLQKAQEGKGWIVPFAEAKQMGANGLFAARKGALAISGSWFVNWYLRNCPFEIGFAPLPVGPEGRKSMMNGIADCIWSGTRHPDEAWRWVSFLGSLEGQMIVAEYGVVFPSIREAADRAAEAMASNGANVAPYLETALSKDMVFYPPLTFSGSEIQELGKVAMDDIFLFGVPAHERLIELDRAIEELFEE